MREPIHVDGEERDRIEKRLRATIRALRNNALAERIEHYRTKKEDSRAKDMWDAFCVYRTHADDLEMALCSLIVYGQIYPDEIAVALAAAKARRSHYPPGSSRRVDVDVDVVKDDGPRALPEHGSP